MTDEESDVLENDLTEIFQEFVTVEVVSENSQPAAQLVVCNMSYRTRSSESNASRAIRQTAVVLQANELHLPEFALTPHRKGLLGKLTATLVGATDLNFEDSPEFSDAFHLHGWADDAVRALFTRELREHLSTQPDWSVRGSGKRLIIFRENTVCTEEQREEFVQDALRILSLFRDAETELDQHPEIHRDTKPGDLRQKAESMGGLAGAMLARQLEKIAVTPDELSHFLSQPVPRSPPPGLKRQLLGDNFILIPVGALFFAVGLVLGALTFFMSDNSTGRGVGLMFMIVFPLVGGLMAGLTLRHRRRKMRLLRDGVLTKGIATKVTRSTIMVNDQVRYVVSITYIVDGQERTTSSSVDGLASKTARRAVETQTALTVLVDPTDSSHVVCTDFLTVFE